MKFKKCNLATMIQKVLHILGHQLHISPALGRIAHMYSSHTKYIDFLDKFLTCISKINHYDEKDSIFNEVLTVRSTVHMHHPAYFLGGAQIL